MNWRPKRLLQWKEPTAFRQEKNETETVRWRWWYKPLAVPAAMCLLWVSALGEQVNRSGDWSVFIPSLGQSASLAAGALGAVYFLPWLMRRVPVYISVYDEGIGRIHGNHGYYLKFSKVAAFGWETREHFQVLTMVQRRGGSKLRLGVPREICAGTIQELLLRHGAVPLPTALSPAPESSAFATRPARV